MSDRELVARINKGDKSALETVFRSHYTQLCNFALSYTKAADDAEDIVSTVFSRIWANHSKWNPPAGIRAYLFTAVRNGALNHLRDAGRGDVIDASVHTIADEGDISNVAEQSSEVARIWKAAMQLSETQRLVVSLRHRYELEWEEVTHVTGLSHSAAVKQYQRGIGKLKELLET